jgi:mannose-6-phosphate isomerase-like protein (cupin superfamily)
MPTHITHPTRIAVPGQPPKVIEEYVGLVNSGTADVSVARMVAPPGWAEEAQRPEFDEYTIVLRGLLRVESDDGVLDVRAGEGVVTRRGERVRYSTVDEEAEYVAVCLPAFSPDTVNRESA